MHRSWICSGRTATACIRGVRAYRPKSAHSLKGARQEQAHPVKSNPADFRTFLKTLLPQEANRQVTDTLALQLFTHKSYDHGQTPYNDKLAFMGTRTLHAALCLHLASRSSQSPLAIAGKDINAIYKPVLLDTLGHYNLAAVAGTLGLDASLLRWKPANSKDLKASGLARAQSDALLAVIGWLDLSVGTRQAQAFCQDKVIPGLLSAKSQNE